MAEIVSFEPRVVQRARAEGALATVEERAIAQANQAIDALIAVGRSAGVKLPPSSLMAELHRMDAEQHQVMEIVARCITRGAL